MHPNYWSLFIVSSAPSLVLEDFTRHSPQSKILISAQVHSPAAEKMQAMFASSCTNLTLIHVPTTP